MRKLLTLAAILLPISAFAYAPQFARPIDWHRDGGDYRGNYGYYHRGDDDDDWGAILGGMVLGGIITNEINNNPPMERIVVCSVVYEHDAYGNIVYDANGNPVMVRQCHYEWVPRQ